MTGLCYFHYHCELSNCREQIEWVVTPIDARVDGEIHAPMQDTEGTSPSILYRARVPPVVVFFVESRD